MRKRLHVMVYVVIFAMLFGTLYSCSGKKTTTTGKTTGTSPTVKTTVKASGTVKTTTRPTGTQQTTGVDSGSEQIADGETGDGEIPGEEPGGSSAPSEFLSYDFGGRTIWIEYLNAVPSGGEFIADFDDIPLSRYNADGTYQKGYSKSADLKYDHWREIEQKMNCKIRVIWRAKTGWDTTLARDEILSGTYKYSLCWPHLNLYTWAKNNLIVPLDDYIDVNSIEKLRDPLVRIQSTVKGKFYTVSAESLSIRYQGIQYNPAIRDRDGLPDLFELFNNGNWTWDKLTEIAVDATRDFNGDGITDQYGACYFTASNLAACLLHSNGVGLITEENNLITHNLQDPAFSRALYFVSDLINIYKVIVPGITNYDKGKTYMHLAGQFGTHIKTAYIRGQIKSYVVPHPIGPDNSDGKIVPEVIKFGHAIPATEKDPEGIARLLVNLIWTYNDSGKPKLTYDEYRKDFKSWLESYMWEGASADLEPLIDFIQYGAFGDKYVSLTNFDIWNNGFPGLLTQFDKIFNELQKATPVSQALNSVLPSVDYIINELN